MWSCGTRDWSRRRPGIAAAADSAWQDADAHFENALRTADQMPHRVE